MERKGGKKMKIRRTALNERVYREVKTGKIIVIPLKRITQRQIEALIYFNIEVEIDEGKEKVTLRLKG